MKVSYIILIIFEIGGDFKLDNIRRSFFFTFPKKNNINVIIYTKNDNVPDVSFLL